MLFQVSYERFLEEIGNEKIKKGDKNQLEIEDLGTMFAYYLNSLDRFQTYVFVALKKELTPTQSFFLNSISKPSKRIIDTNFKKSINETINKLDDRQNLIDSLKRKFNPT